MASNDNISGCRMERCASRMSINYFVSSRSRLCQQSLGPWILSLASCLVACICFFFSRFHWMRGVNTLNGIATFCLCTRNAIFGGPTTCLWTLEEWKVVTRCDAVHFELGVAYENNTNHLNYLRDPALRPVFSAHIVKTLTDNSIVTVSRMRFNLCEQSGRKSPVPNDYYSYLMHFKRVHQSQWQSWR